MPNGALPAGSTPPFARRSAPSRTMMASPSTTTMDDLLTARLRLVRPREADLPDLARMNADPATMAMLLGVRTREQTAQALQRMLAHWQEHRFGWWIARDSQ